MRLFLVIRCMMRRDLTGIGVALVHRFQYILCSHLKLGPASSLTY